MSIIYDALRKSQQARAAKAPVVVARRLKIQRKNILITLLILTAIFAVLAALTIPGGPSLKLPSLLGKKKVQPPAPVVAVIPRLMLDGVFLSDTEKLAMINRRSYHEGDSISGMKVISIAFDQVTLRGKTHSVTLRNTLTQLN